MANGHSSSVFHPNNHRPKTRSNGKVKKPAAVRRLSPSPLDFSRFCCSLTDRMPATQWVPKVARVRFFNFA
jgi:hypothetical protein